MKRRGLSEVVTVILIILIVLVAIGIVWSFVTPTIQKVFGGAGNNGQLGRLIGCVDLKLEVGNCGVLDSGNYQVRVDRGSGQFEFKEIVFNFKTASKEFTREERVNFPSEFGSATYTFDLSTDTNGEDVESVEVASILENGNVCEFTSSVSCSGNLGIGGPICGDGVCESGEDQNNCPEDCGGSQNPLYCAPNDLTTGNNKSVLIAYNNINVRYPVGANKGVRTAPVVSDLYINGVKFKVVEFRFRPFEPSYANAPFTSTWDDIARIIVPDPSTRQINKNTLALSMQAGTSGGNPAGFDPIRGSEYPAWYFGTEDSINFQKTFGSVVDKYNVPMVFYHVVPAGAPRGIQFTLALQTELQALARDRTPTITWDDNLCNGALSDEAIVHGCLNQLSFVDYNDPTTPWPYIDHHPAIFYSLAASRLIDASESVLDTVASQKVWKEDLGQGAVYNFDFGSTNGKVIAMGGSKRGAAMEEFIVADSRVKAGLIGHANAGNYSDYFKQRISLFEKTYPPGIYIGDADQLAFVSNTQKWFDYYDPSGWDPSMSVGKLVARSFGSIDTFYAEGAELLFADNLPSDVRLLALPNYGHGFGTVDHAVLFRSLVNRVVTGSSADYLKVDAKYYFDDENVEAVVTGTNDFSDVNVELWCTKGDLDDYPPFNNNRGVWPPTLVNWAADGSNLDNTYNGFQPVAPDLRYSYLDKVTMTDLGNGRYSANVNSIIDVGWADEANVNYIGCYVRAVKGIDGGVATSYFLMNEPLCDSSLLPIKQG